MKEGEPVLGGPQANPGGEGVLNSGAQPIVSGPVSSPAQPRQNRYITQPPSHFTPQQPISSGAGDVVLPKSEQPQNKKRWIVVGTVLAVVAIITLVLVFALKAVQNRLPEDVVQNKELMVQFGDNYIALIDGYNDIGYNPSENMTEAIENYNFGLIDTTRLSILHRFVVDTELSLDSLREKISSYQDLLDNAQNTTDDIKTNIAILYSFNDAFVLPMYSIYNDDILPTTECETTDDMDRLLESSDENISNAAKTYKEAYCDLNQIKYNQKDFKEFDNSKIVSAKTALVETLKLIDADKIKYEEITDITNRLRAKDE